jgi:hypothetical protein
MADDRTNYLTTLTEEQLRNVVLIPLLTQMSFQDVIEYHGAVEKGKDIICRYLDKLGVTRYVGVVVKRTDIHGAVSQTGSAGEVLLQIQQTFDEPYTDIFDLKEVVIDECWVVTSGIVKPSAIESIQGMLRKSNLNKLVRFIDQRKLCTLIDRYMPGFWHSDRYLMLILHELKGPIYSVRAAAEFLNHIAGKTGDIDRARIREVARDIELQMVLVARMLESNHLFTVSELRVHAREADLNAVAEHVVDQIRPFAERRLGQPREVQLRKAPSHVPCEIDEHMISQAIWNLVDNGLRYGNPQKPVIVSVEDAARSVVEVVVTDFGIGIPPEAVENIMQPHFRAENAMRVSFAGAGLGLTVADRVARAHDGMILVRSCANPTVVVLTVPKRRTK